MAGLIGFGRIAAPRIYRYFDYHVKWRESQKTLE